MATTVFWNSSWRLVRRKRRSRKSARFGHAQCVNWKQNPLIPKLAQKLAVSRAKKCRQMTTSAGESTLMKTRRPSRGALQTHKLKRDVWQRNTRKKKEGSSLLSRWFWTLFTAGFLHLALSRIGEADNPGRVCATAGLYDVLFDEIGQWAANLTNKSEGELEPLDECSVNVL